MILTRESKIYVKIIKVKPGIPAILKITTEKSINKYLEKFGIKLKFLNLSDSIGSGTSINIDIISIKPQKNQLVML